MMNNNYWDLPQFKKTAKKPTTTKKNNLLLKIFANTIKNKLFISANLNFVTNLRGA